MTRANVEEIVVSSEAVEQLLAGSLRIATFSFGRTRIVKAMGISMSRLHRLLSLKKPARPTFDLVYRMHRRLGLDWPYIFTARHHEGLALDILGKSLEKELPEIDEQEIDREEEKTRERLREIINRIGLTKCAKGCGIARATLHSYLETTGLSVSLLWRIHLFTGEPYSVISSGRLDEEEKALSESMENPEDVTGRFSDLYEPVVCLAERCAYEGLYETIDMHAPFLRSMLEKKLRISQHTRLVRILALYEKGRKNINDADALLKKCWQKLKKSEGSTNLALLTLYMGVAAGLQVPGLSKEIADHIKSLTDDNLILANIYRVQANEACIMMKMFEAEHLARTAILHASNVTGPFRNNAIAYAKYILTMASWPLGDYEETLSRVERLLAWPPTPHGVRITLVEIEFNIRVWLRDAAGTGRALKQLKKYSSHVSNTKAFRRSHDIYHLRFLLLKEDIQGSLFPAEERKKNSLAGRMLTLGDEVADTDVQSILAVCRYYSRGDREGLKTILDGLLGGTLPRHSAPILSLPDLFEAARKAGLWSRDLEDWKDSAVENGMLYLELPRP
ncbi:MAG: hypothetical protein E3J72_14375 [Planctomycetota bacterium]|nr:MAG: hypothetical protein E3J72_14375 [Planctomycetota bacterium]